MIEITEKLIDSLLTNLYTEDKNFLEGMKNNNRGGDDLKRYRFWEWTQGVGLYGLYKLYAYTSEKKYLDLIVKYFDERFIDGLPSKNVNTVAPMLTMACVYNDVLDPRYLEKIEEWSKWIMEEMPRTKEGGIQHTTSDSLNDGELWDDTLVMTVLFLQRAGMILGRRDYIDEAIYQFLIHTKYLVERSTGLWYHGWSFVRGDNFSGALWGRGNAWITIGIPDFIENLEGNPAVKRLLEQTLSRQAEALSRFQTKDGMWRTLIDDETSYEESSATAGFAYGIYKGARCGYIDKKYVAVADRAIEGLKKNIAGDGTVLNVSAGTPVGRDDKAFYKTIQRSPQPYGQSMALLAFIEHEISEGKNK